MLLKRIIIAAIFIPVFVFLVMQGGFYFLGLVCGIIAVGLVEFHQGANKDDLHIPFRNIILGLCIPVAAYFKGEDILPFVITVIIFIIFFSELFNLKTEQPQTNIVFNLGGILYISYLFSFIVIMRNLPVVGVKLVVTVLFATWMGDTGAFTVGTLLGKHAFFSTYSSHKSVEGFLGAIAFSMLAVFLSRLWLPIPLLHVIILGLLAGVCGEMGDFFESMLKRSLKIKDFGKFLPGHGGILDRFDSLFFSVPIFFYYTKYILELGA